MFLTKPIHYNSIEALQCPQNGHRRDFIDFCTNHICKNSPKHTDNECKSNVVLIHLIKNVVTQNNHGFEDCLQDPTIHNLNIMNNPIP